MIPPSIVGECLIERLQVQKYPDIRACLALQRIQRHVHGLRNFPLGMISSQSLSDWAVAEKAIDAMFDFKEASSTWHKREAIRLYDALREVMAVRAAIENLGEPLLAA